MAISLAPTALQDFEHYCRHYGLTLSADLTLERVLEPEFWAHVGHKLKPFDRVTFMAADRTFLAETVVLAAARGFAKLKVLQHYSLVESVEELEAQEADNVELTVKWNGPAEKWTVIRNSDGAKLKTGLDSKPDAETFATNYRRAA